MAKRKTKKAAASESDETHLTNLEQLDMIAFTCDAQIAHAKYLLKELDRVLDSAGHIQSAINVLLPSPEGE